MRSERSTDTETLASRYGISRRLATRVVALLSRNLDFTPTVLAAAAEDKSLARLLLRPELLNPDEALTEHKLRSVAEELDCMDADLLRLVESEKKGWRTVALEDDVLADAARDEADGATEEMGLVRTAPRDMSLRETHDLFTPEEVARLKLSVLTSQDPDQRIEAVRKLVFAPIEGPQKASMLVNVLVDGEAQLRVRREALRSLEQIGFRSDMAEALRGLFEEDRQAEAYSVQRLGALLSEAEAGEAALSLAVVLELFDQCRNRELTRQLLMLIGRSSHILVGNASKTEQFVQATVRHLARDFEFLRGAADAALTECLQQGREMVEDMLWRETERTDEARVRSLLLGLCESVVSDADRERELASRAVAEILNPLLAESEKARLRYALVRVGEPALKVVLGKIEGADPIEKAELVRLLDVLCTESDVSDESVHEAVRALLDLLKLADTATRRIVVEAAVLGDARIPTPLQRDLAEELLSLMQELNLPDTLSVIRHTLESIGFPALDPSYRFMRRAYPSEAAQYAALALSQLIIDHAERLDREMAQQILALCEDLLDDDQLEDGEFVLPLASVCGETDFGASRFEGIMRRLRDVIWSVPYTIEVLDALGILAGARNAQQEHQEALFELFDGIVTFRPRAEIGVRQETEEGPVYTFGREVEFDTRIVPAAVRGLERICLSPQAAPDLRTRIAKRLLILWEGVSKVRIVWGPSAIEALITAMCSAACMPESTVQTKVRLATSLLRFLNKLSVIRSIGQICSQPDTEPAARRLVVEACTALLDEWETCEEQDVERRAELLDAIGRIAANPSLQTDEREGATLVERALQALFSGLREGLDEVREPLVVMRESPNLSPEQKRDVDARLSKVTGLVRSARRG